ncbi:MAG: hypothetical protein Kow0049_17150 [Stanieria sp.]
MNFSAQVWNKIDNIYNSILIMPFVQELKLGLLKREIFQHYMIQDAIYLGEFARVLAIISAKAPEPDLQLQFANNVREAIIVEQGYSNFICQS